MRPQQSVILILWRDQGPTGVSERCPFTFKSNLQDNLWVFHINASIAGSKQKMRTNIKLQ